PRVPCPLTLRRARGATLFPYTTLFRSRCGAGPHLEPIDARVRRVAHEATVVRGQELGHGRLVLGEVEQGLGVSHQPCVITFTSRDRKSTRLNSSHVAISYAVFCLKKKK